MFARFKKLNDSIFSIGFILYLMPMIGALGMMIFSLSGGIQKTSFTEYMIHLFVIVVMAICYGYSLSPGRYARPEGLKKNHRYITIFSYEHRYFDDDEIIEHYAMVNDGKKRLMVKFNTNPPPSAFIITSDGKIEGVLDMREVFTEG